MAGTAPTLRRRGVERFEEPGVVAVSPSAVAPVGRRVLALAVDQLALAVLALVGALVATALRPGSGAEGAAIALAVGVLGLVLAEGISGAGLGSVVVGLRTVAAATGAPAGVLRIALRSAFLGVGALFLLVGSYVVAASGTWDPAPTQRGWHDRLAGTLVLQSWAVAPRSRRIGRSGAPGTPVPSVPALVVGPASALAPDADSSPADEPRPVAPAPERVPLVESAAPSARPDDAPRAVPGPDPMRSTATDPASAAHSVIATPLVPSLDHAPRRVVVPVRPTSDRDEALRRTFGPPAGTNEALPIVEPPTSLSRSDVPRRVFGPQPPTTRTGVAPERTSSPTEPGLVARQTDRPTVDDEGQPVLDPMPIVPKLNEVELTRLNVRDEVAAPPRLVLFFDTGEEVEVRGIGVVGRAPQDDASREVLHVVAIDDPDRSVSRVHLRFGPEPDGRLWIVDAGSTNGTVVEDPSGAASLLPAGRRAVVGAGWTVRFGSRIAHVRHRA